MAKRHWTKHDSKIVYENQPFFWVTEDNVTMPDGRLAKYGVVHTHGAVFIVALTKAGKFIFVQQERYPIGGETIEFVAGGLRGGEDPMAQAAVELHEEINATAESFKLLGTIVANPSRQQTKLYLVLAEGVDDSALGSHNQENNEAINDIQVLTPAQVVELIKHGKLVDSATLAGLNLYWSQYGFPKL